MARTTEQVLKGSFIGTAIEKRFGKRKKKKRWLKGSVKRPVRCVKCEYLTFATRITPCPKCNGKLS